MDRWEINFEQRMALRVSDLAAAVLEEDKLSFRAKSPSDMLCRIFKYHYYQSSASIGRSLARQREKLEALLPPGPERDKTVQCLLADLEQSLEAQVCTEKGQTRIPIRLQNDVTDMLADCKVLEGRYYSSPTRYMKAVVEDYCRLMPTQREQIYFADRFELMEMAIARNRQLKVWVGTNKTFLVHPYRLMTDKLANSWYLAGYTRTPGQPAEEKKRASLRVSSMASVELTREKATVTPQQRQEIEERIQEQGVQFLVENPCLVKVKMTEDGARKYLSMSTMRPLFISREGDVWSFYCSRLQALRYFSRMAQDCEVLEPKRLRRDMLRYLKKSLKIYEKNTEETETVT